jgi:hypothetical protein
MHNTGMAIMKNYEIVETIRSRKSTLLHLWPGYSAMQLLVWQVFSRPW